MKALMQPPFRRQILLALAWNVFEFNQGVAEYAKKANWILDDLMCHNGRVPVRWKGDGIITHVGDRSDKDLIQVLRGAKVPIVNLGYFSSSFISSRILPDNDRIGESAAEHLLSRGFENYAFYRLSSSAVVVERMNAFRRTIEAAGKNFIDLNFETQLSDDPKNRVHQGRLLAWLSAKLKKVPKPIATMAQYDGEANDIVRACLSVGIQIPHEVAVIGVDNDPIYSTLGPITLTSVDSNRRLAGYRAAELLDKLLDGEKWIEKTIRIAPGGVVVRESTDIVAVEDPYVSKALRFIWNHFKENISVEDVIRFSGISRRGLYDRFERKVGHPIYEELMRMRLERAKELLRKGGHKLQYIAVESGLEDAERLSKSFKRFCGMSPTEYRNENLIPSAQADQEA